MALSCQTCTCCKYSGIQCLYSCQMTKKWKKKMCIALCYFVVITATAYRIPDLVTSVMIRSQCWQWLSREAIRGTQGSDVTHTGTFHTINRVHWNMFFSFTWHTWSEAKTWLKTTLKNSAGCIWMQTKTRLWVNEVQSIPRVFKLGWKNVCS